MRHAVCCLLMAFLSGGCLNGHFQRREYKILVTGVIVECASPHKAADLGSISIGGEPLARARPIQLGETITTTQPVRLFVSSEDSESASQYEILVGGGMGTSPTAVTHFEEDVWPPEIVLRSGWSFLWGIEPRGRMRFVRAGAVTTAILLYANEDGTDSVYLLNGSQVNITCDTVSAAPYRLLNTSATTQGRFVNIKLDPETRECLFDPPLPDPLTGETGHPIPTCPGGGFICDLIDAWDAAKAP